MKYPKFMTQLNNLTGYLCGVLVLIIGLLQVMEGILRSVFSRPTSWSLDVSLYLLIWAIFMGSSYAFQEKGHVAVDFVLTAIGKRTNVKVQRIITIIGYFMALIFLVVLAKISFSMITDALAIGELTLANVQIPIAYLYASMLLGSVFMIATVVYIMADLCGGGDKYL